MYNMDVQAHCAACCLVLFIRSSLYFRTVTFRLWPSRLLFSSSSCLEMFSIFTVSPFCAVSSLIPRPDPMTACCPSCAPHHRCWAVSFTSGHWEPSKDFALRCQLLVLSLHGHHLFHQFLSSLLFLNQETDCDQWAEGKEPFLSMERVMVWVYTVVCKSRINNNV